MQASAAPKTASQGGTTQEHWRRRLVRTLLYGKSVDRSVKARARIGLAIVAFALCYAVIAGRLVMYAATDNTTVRRSYSADAVATARPDILDRNGEILATDVRMPSLFAEPHRIVDKDEAVELLATVIPDLDVAEVRERLSSRRRFVWLRREITAKQRQEIHRLGLPGIGFMHENKRVYPAGPLVSHLIGHVNIDNQGIAGIEKWLDSRGLADLHLAGLARDRLQQPVELAVDMRVQHAMRDELVKARTKYKALAAAGLVLDARTGEIVSMVSVPDYDPNNPREALDPTRINRITTGVYEMGSTFKALTLAMAIDSGRMNSTRCSMPACRCNTASTPSTTIAGRSACSRWLRSSPIRRTSAPHAWRWRSASSTTSSSCAGSASSTGCAPRFPKARSRSFRVAGRRSTP